MSLAGSNARRVRLLYLNSDANPNPYFRVIAEHLDASRFDLRWASVAPGGELQRDAARLGLESFALGASGRHSYPQAVLRLARRLRLEQIDIVHTHLLDGCFVGLLAAHLARTPTAVMTAHHSHEIPLHGSPPLTAVDRLCAARLADGVIAPSRQMGHTLMDFHGVPREKVTVIDHGFELETFDPTRTNREAARTELGLNGRLVIGSLGRMFWIKNYESLIRAFAEVAGRDEELVLLIVGAGDGSPLQELARALGIGDRVRVLPRREDAAALFAAMDVFVHPALAESFGMVIVEAMAMGKPIVSTAVGIAPDVLEDSAIGVLAPDGRVESLRAALSEVLARRPEWETMGAEAHRRSKRFSAERMVDEYESYYLRMLGAARRGGQPHA